MKIRIQATDIRCLSGQMGGVSNNGEDIRLRNDNNTNLIYEYQEEGTFEVVLTASNDFCSSTDTLLITIEAREVADIGAPFVDINAEEAEEDKTKGEDFSLNINEVEISNSSGALVQYEELNVRIYSITGQIVFDAFLPNGGTTILLDRGELSQGVYQVELSNKEMIVFTEKCYLN